MKKNDVSDEFVPAKFIHNSILGDSPVLKRLRDLLQKENIVGPLTWVMLENSDKDLAADFREYIEQNKSRLEKKYTKHGANIEKLAINREIKKNRTEVSKGIVKKSASTKQTKFKSKKERIQEATDLLAKDINTLEISEIKTIMNYSNIDYERLKPYWEKFQELKSKKTILNKPKPIQAAKALITFNFSGKSNPMKWIDYEQIIKAKLYCAKMGMEYLESEAPEELKAVMSQVSENLNEVLKSLKVQNINEIKF